MPLPTPRNAPVHARISASMLHNSGVFLRKAAEEIAGHRDMGDPPFDADRATIVTVLIQTAVELASTATIIRHGGLAGVMRKGVPQTESEAEQRWLAGDIKTKTFEDLKADAAKLFGDIDFWSLVDDFQVRRNKLVHFHQPLDQAELFDLKYEATHVLIQMIMTLSQLEEDELPEGSASFLGQELFDRLIAFEPYRYRIEKVAHDIDRKVIKCIICDLRAYSVELEKCLGCGYAGDLRFLTCPDCRQEAVFYDHGNLPINSSLPALCGGCGWRGRAAHCAECRLDFIAPEGSTPRCPWSEDHERLRQRQR